jgi:lipoprotein-anchoring transpeptidase ErfK/SrfK
MALGGGASAQYRGYGDTYSGAPDYYDGGPFGGGQYEPYYKPYLPKLPRPTEQSDGYNQRGPRGDYGYDQRDEGRGGYDPGDDAGRDDARGYDQGPPPPPPLPYADPLRQGRGDPNDPATGDAGDPGGAGPHKASDLDLGESANRTTRTEVENKTRQPPGTIVIDTGTRHLYFTEPNGQALEYGIGVGRQGFAWKGVARVERKSEWPDWIPPSDMLKRRPDLPTRMAGGIENPLGARALYLFQGNKDTLFRIHGTNEPDTIGKAVSSGCIRMMNADVIDLYKRVPVGTKVVVL